MSPEETVALIGASVALLGLIFVVFKKVPKRLKAHHYTRKWRDLQKLCVSKETWPKAITTADKLVDEVLRKRRTSGKTMGERMVEAGDQFTNKDAVWQAHKLANHVEQNHEAPLREDDVKAALVAFRQALRDLGALR